jgi:hypothetical protein
MHEAGLGPAFFVRTRTDNRRMHLVVPYAAGLCEAGAHALHILRLPHLERLLARMQPAASTATDEHSLNLPHEHVLAASRGWPLIDGCLPLAAWGAFGDGLPLADADLAWGLLTPSFWEVGREQIVLRDPAELNLDAAESQALLQAVRALFETLGWTLHWAAPLRWYATHASLASLATATLDRVVGRAIDPWLPQRLAGRQVRSLQSEVQMLLHSHPINDAREARGALPVNSFWLSGTGVTPRAHDSAAEPTVDASLRTPLLHEDWALWVDTWHALDATVLRELEACARNGDAVSLTLCGERRAQRFERQPRSAWHRLTQAWRRVAAAPLLATL